MRLTVKVKPSSGRSKVTDTGIGTLIVHLKAAPEDGKANEELLKTLAKHYGVTSKRVRLILGATSRTKVVDIDLPDHGSAD